MLEHKGYYAEVNVDIEYGILFGQSVGMKDGFTFQAKSVDDVVPAFHQAVEDYLEFCVADKVEPAKPFSGKIALRVPPETHRAATSTAKEQGKSLNAWITSLISRSLNESPEAQFRLAATDASQEQGQITNAWGTSPMSGSLNESAEAQFRLAATDASREQGQSTNVTGISRIAMSINDVVELLPNARIFPVLSGVFFLKDEPEGQPEYGYVSLVNPSEAVDSWGAVGQGPGVAHRGGLFQPATLPNDPVSPSAI